MPNIKTYLGLGSNLGDRMGFLRHGVRGVSHLGRIEGLSRIYETGPIGGPEQPQYLNRVVSLVTDLSPDELLRHCQIVEYQAGRQRGIRFGPRTLDVDILLYGEQVTRRDALTIPHPRLAQRRFVLDPLFELAPDLVLPTGEPVAVLRQSVQDQGVYFADDWEFDWESHFIPTLMNLREDLVGLTQVDSTNLEIRRRYSAREGVDGMTVVAEQQTQGRGRLGRVWDSPSGTGLYVSRLVVPERGLDPLLGFAVAVALSETVAALTGLKPGLKWPNDGILGGKKYAGILVEAAATPHPYAIIGVGINVHGATDSRFPTGITLDQAAERTVDRVVLFEQLMLRLDHWIQIWTMRQSAKVLQAWRTYHVYRGAMVHIWQHRQIVVAGIVEDVDDTGRLLVRKSGGDIEAIGAGEVSVRLADGGYAP